MHRSVYLLRLTYSCSLVNQGGYSIMAILLRYYYLRLNNHMSQSMFEADLQILLCVQKFQAINAKYTYPYCLAFKISIVDHNSQTV